MTRNLFAIIITCFCFQLSAQRAEQLNINTTNVSFVADTIYDYRGSVYKNGSSDYVLDSVKLGDVLVDISSNHYRIDSVIVDVSDALISIWVTCLESNCISPQTGNGFISRPTDNYDLIPNPYNSSQTITELQVAKNIVSNWKMLDSLVFSNSLVDSTRLTQDSIIVYYQAGVEIGRDTLSLATPETDPIYAADSAQLKADIANANYAIFDTTFTSTGNDISAAMLQGWFTGYEEVWIDAILDISATSDLIISLTNADSLRNKKLFISAVNNHTSDDIIILGIQGNPDYILKSGENVYLQSQLLDGVYEWVFINPRTDLSGVTYNYRNLSALINTTNVLEVGDRVKLDDTGAEYLVQADSVSGYTVDGVAVVPNGSNYAVLSNDEYKVDHFGAIAEDGLNDSPAFNNLFQFMEATRIVKKVNFGTGDYNLQDTVFLPSTAAFEKDSRINITCDGCKLILGDSVGLYRMPSDQTNALSLISNHTYTFTNLEFFGNATQIGIEIGATYKMRIEDNVFDDLMIGVRSLFSLQGQYINNVVLVPDSIGLEFDSGDVYWSGAFTTNSSFNINTIESNRIYCDANTFAGILMREGDHNIFLGNIIEGAAPRYGMYIDLETNTTINFNRIQDTWFESSDDTTSYLFWLRPRQLLLIDGVNRDKQAKFWYIEGGDNWTIDVKNIEYWGNTGANILFEGSNTSYGGEIIKGDYTTVGTLDDDNRWASNIKSNYFGGRPNEVFTTNYNGDITFRRANTRLNGFGLTVTGILDDPNSTGSTLIGNKFQARYKAGNGADFDLDYGNFTVDSRTTGKIEFKHENRFLRLSADGIEIEGDTLYFDSGISGDIRNGTVTNPMTGTNTIQASLDSLYQKDLSQDTDIAANAAALIPNDFDDNYLILGRNDSLVNSALYQAVNGNVGIGTTTPAYKLHVVGNIGLSSQITTDSTTTTIAETDTLLLNQSGVTKKISAIKSAEQLSNLIEQTAEVTNANSLITTYFTANPNVRKLTQVAHVTIAASSDVAYTFPTPSSTYEGKEVIIVPVDLNATYNVTATAGTDLIWDGSAFVTTMTITEATTLMCMELQSSYYWFKTN